MTGNKTGKIFLTAALILFFGTLTLKGEAFTLNLNGVKNFIQTKTKLIKSKRAKKVKTHPSINTRRNNYVELEDLELNDTAMEKFEEIYMKEAQELRPLALDLEAKYIRLDELNAMHCRFYQRKCKEKLKAKYEALEPEIKELERQIWLKKEFYKIKYINATTRAQDIKLHKIIYKKTGGNMKLW